MAILNAMKLQPEFLEVAGSILILVCFFALQAFHCNPHTIRQRDRYGLWTLIAQVLLAYAPVPLHGVLWGFLGGFLGGFLAGSVLVVLRGSLLAWGLYSLNAAAVFALALARFPLGESVHLTLATLLVGLMVLGLTRLGDLVIEQLWACDEVAWVAISKERLRFARDLHDLLGYSLSTITLKSELTHRLVGVNDEGARAELAETLRIARQALADVRAVASGYREMSLVNELRSVRGVLHTAGVEVTLEGTPGKLDQRVSTVLAIVLREAATNLLRHSSATRCRITLGQRHGRVRMTVSNDGVPPAQASAVAGRLGSGLDNLASRLASAGGELAIALENGWFHLRVSCPSGSRMMRSILPGPPGHAVR